MNVGNFPVYQPAHQNLIAVAYGASCLEYCAGLLVFPPTARYSLTGYSLGEIRSRSWTCLLHDSVLFDKPYRIHSYRLEGISWRVP